MISRIPMMERHWITKTLKDKHHKVGWEYNLIMILKQVQILIERINSSATVCQNMVSIYHFTVNENFFEVFFFLLIKFFVNCFLIKQCLPKVSKSFLLKSIKILFINHITITHTQKLIVRDWLKKSAILLMMVLRSNYTSK